MTLMTRTHTCPDCGLRLTQRIKGGSIDKGCPDCRPGIWPDVDRDIEHENPG